MAPGATDRREERRQELKVAMVARDREDIEPLRVALEAAREAGLGAEDVDPAAELLRKLEADAAPLTFVDVHQEDMERLQAAKTREQAVAILMQCFKLTVDDGFRAQILAEFHYHNFALCQQKGFSAEKTSTFLSIMKKVHTKSILEEKLNVEQARELFERLLGLHSQHLPPFKVGAFTKSEAEMLREYAARNFFRLYSLHVYTSQRKEDLAVELREQRLVPEVPALAPLHAKFEADLREATQTLPHPELLTMRSSLRRRSSLLSEKTFSPVREEEAAGEGGKQAEVDRAVEEALQHRLGALDERLQNLPVPSVTAGAGRAKNAR